MKKVVFWFRDATFCAVFWLVLSLMDLSAQIFLREEVYDSNLLILIISLLAWLSGLGAKFFIVFCGLYYLSYVVENYERDEKLKELELKNEENVTKHQ